MYQRALRSNELMHHGIRGQKWGVRRFQNPDGTWKNAKARSRHADQQKKMEEKPSSKRTNSPKSSVLNTKISDMDAKAITLGKSAVQSILGGGFATGIPGFKNITKTETAVERMSKVNPQNNHMNCGNCVIANEARKRGIDASAMSNRKGMTINDFKSHFSNLSKDSVTNPTVKVKNLDFSDPNTKKQLVDLFIKGKLSPELESRGKTVRNEIANDLNTKYPDGSRGALFVPGSLYSHWISWNKEGGKVTFENPQDHKLDLTKCFAQYNNMYSKTKDPRVNITSIRIDNADFDDSVSKAIRPSGLVSDLTSPFKIYKSEELRKIERGEST